MSETIITQAEDGTVTYTHTHADGTTGTHTVTVGENTLVDDQNAGVHDHAESFDPTVFNAELYGSVDYLGGTTGPNGKPIWSAAQASTYLFRANAGYGVGGNMVMPTSGVIDQLNYGFHTSQASLEANGYVYFVGTSGFGLSEYFNFKPFTAAQQDAAREAMQMWDDVVSTEFVETNVNDADIAFGNYTNQPGTQAYARLLADKVTSNPAINAQIRDIGGDVWVAFNTQSNFQLDEGGYGMNTLVHEVGHGFGMLHPGDYNFVAGGPALSYASHAEYYQDTRSYSILSYWNPRDIGARDFDWSRMNIAYGATPMVHDILAMQQKYGAEMTTRTDDTTYGFNSNAGRDAFDFVKTPAPMMTIWDAGGIDTLDASGYNTNQVIDLNPGALSSIGGITADEFPTFAQVNANRAAANMPPIAQSTYDANKAAFMTNPAFYGRLQDNVGIAYGATIENAVGGGGHDTMLGNAVDNVMSGNGGNDLIASGLGNDRLDGGLGNDEMLGGAGNDTYVVGQSGDIVTELANEGTDTVESSISYTLGANLENLTLTGTAASGTGNELANVIAGNASDNVLNGGIGGDSMLGGAGNDFYFVENAGDSVVELGGEGTDTVSSSISYTLTDNVENLILTDSATTGTGNGLNNVITGNALANVLSGGAGNDRLVGGDGVDSLVGGLGNDIFVGEINATKVASKSGPVSLDRVLDFAAGDVLDLSGIDANTSVAGDQAFTFVGHANPNNAGEIGIRTFGNMNAAEKALGMELDGIDGASTFAGPVTVVFGNVDGGAPDFAMVLMNNATLTSSDFNF
jgi:serralysin